MFVSETDNELRRCGRCGQVKPLSDFAWRRIHKGQRGNYCRPCHAAYKQEHYAKNRERYVANAARLRNAVLLERTAFLLEFFRRHPCGDCGETDPVILEFDHLGDKEFNIAAGIRVRNWQAVL